MRSSCCITGRRSPKAPPRRWHAIRASSTATSAPPMLEIRELDLFYREAQALDRVSLAVAAREIVAIVGSNGAGKTSLIHAIFGMARPSRGSIAFEGREIAGMPSHRICDLGIGQVAEGRQIFPTLSVLENLEMGAVVPRARAGARKALERVYALFPRLA